MSLTSASIKVKSHELGFDLCGVSRAERHPRLARLADWIAGGSAGDMTYLSRSLEERLDPTRVLAGARTVVSLACVYYTGEPSSSVADDERAAIARYAWGDDYHDVIHGRLRALVRWMAERAGPGFEAFSSVDNGPVQERVFAEQAGLGWIGKNTCLINPKLGSWLFLGEVLTNRDLDIDMPAVDQCGTCRRCLDACPTGALTAPYVLDARGCLSYLTIEVRDSVDPEWRDAIGQQIFGCDICQDVCPWNRRSAISEDPAWLPRQPLASARVVDLCALPDAEWRRLIKASAMRRAGLSRIRRSLAYAAAHLRSPDAEVAFDALASHESGRDPRVMDAISWAKAFVRAEGTRQRAEVRNQ
jgi:epoxyqueuosine reductase